MNLPHKINGLDKHHSVSTQRTSHRTTCLISADLLTNIMSKEIDYVITELEVAIQNPEFPYGQFIGLIFIDQKPGFPKVKSTLTSIAEHLENTPMEIFSHSKIVYPITKDTDISGLEITKH